MAESVSDGIPNVGSKIDSTLPETTVLVHGLPCRHATHGNRLTAALLFYKYGHFGRQTISLSLTQASTWSEDSSTTHQEDKMYK